MTRLRLPPRVTGLCDNAQGAVIVCGARLRQVHHVAALLEHVTEDRPDHVIALEERIQVLHEREGSLVSQREVTAAQMPAAIRSALCEEPDVLVINELRSADDARAALDVATSGRLVICSLTARIPLRRRSNSSPRCFPLRSVRGSAARWRACCAASSRSVWSGGSVKAAPLRARFS